MDDRSAGRGWGSVGSWRSTRNATQRNATQRNATHRREQSQPDAGRDQGLGRRAQARLRRTTQGAFSLLCARQEEERGEEATTKIRGSRAVPLARAVSVPYKLAHAGACALVKSYRGGRVRWCRHGARSLLFPAGHV